MLIMQINYSICVAILLVITIYFHYNVYNILISWCGAFFLVRGVIYIALATQISNIKQFLFFLDYRDGDFGGVPSLSTDSNPNQVQMDPLYPLWITLVQLFIFFLSWFLKRNLVAR